MRDFFDVFVGFDALSQEIPPPRVAKGTADLNEVKSCSSIEQERSARGQ